MPHLVRVCGVVVLLRRFHADLPRTRAVSLHAGAVISDACKRHSLLPKEEIVSLPSPLFERRRCD